MKRLHVRRMGNCMSRCASHNADLAEKYNIMELRLKEMKSKLGKPEEKSDQDGNLQRNLPISFSNDSVVQNQISKELKSLRAEIAKSRAILASLEAKGHKIPVEDILHLRQKSFRKHSPHANSDNPLLDALTLELLQSNDQLSKSSSGQTLNINQFTFQENGLLTPNNSASFYGLARSCPILSSQTSALTKSTQTEPIDSIPASSGHLTTSILHSRKIIPNISSTSGFHDLENSSVSNKTVTYYSDRSKEVLKDHLSIFRTTSGPKTPDSLSPDINVRNRSFSFVIAINKGNPNLIDCEEWSTPTSDIVHTPYNEDHVSFYVTDHGDWPSALPEGELTLGSRYLHNYFSPHHLHHHHDFLNESSYSISNNFNKSDYFLSRELNFNSNSPLDYNDSQSLQITKGTLAQDYTDYRGTIMSRPLSTLPEEESDEVDQLSPIKSPTKFSSQYKRNGPPSFTTHVSPPPPYKMPPPLCSNPCTSVVNIPSQTGSSQIYSSKVVSTHSAPSQSSQYKSLSPEPPLYKPPPEYTSSSYSKKSALKVHIDHKPTLVPDIRLSPNVDSHDESEGPQSPLSPARLKIRQLQEQDRHKKSLSFYSKDGQTVDLINGSVEDIELSEDDKEYSSKLIEESKKVSLKHGIRRRRRSNSNSASPSPTPSVTRSTAFDFGQQDEMLDPIQHNANVLDKPSSSLKTPPRSAGKSSSPSSRMPDNLKKKGFSRGLMSDLMETSETESAKGSGGSIEEETELLPNDQCKSDSILPPPSGGGGDSAFPSLPDSFLKKLRLDKDTVFNAEDLTEEDIETKFNTLSLAFKTDKFTLEKRLELHQRHRNLAEKNVETELEAIRSVLKDLGQINLDSQPRDLILKVQNHIDILQQSTTRVSSRAEIYGAVQQENRMCNAIEVMVLYVDNLKKQYERTHHELSETKRLLVDNRGLAVGMSDLINDDSRLSKRSVSGIAGAKSGARRRASVAALPRADGGRLSQCFGNLLDHKSRLASFLTSVPLKNLSPIVTSEKNNEKLCADINSNSSQTPIESPCKSPIVNSMPEIQCKVEKLENDCNEKKETSPEDAIFQKGFEKGVRAKVTQDLTALRDQQKLLYENLEDLMDQQDEQAETDKNLSKLAQPQLLWHMLEWDKFSWKVRLALAGILLAAAVFCMVVTLMPVRVESADRNIYNSWSSLENLIGPFLELHYKNPPPQ